MLNSTEHELSLLINLKILSIVFFFLLFANKSQNTTNCIFPLLNIPEHETFYPNKYENANWMEHEKKIV